MRKTLALALVFGLLLGAAVFATGQNEGAKKQIVIGKVPITLEAQFHQALVKIETDYAMKKYGATLKVIDGQFKSDVALNAVYNFISQKVDGIILHTMDAAVLDQAIKAAHDKGIPISTFYNEPATKANPHVQINEIVTSRQMGVLAAKKWKEFYPGKAIKIGLIDYLNVEHAMQQRSNPFIEGVKSVDATAEVVSRLDGGGSSEKALAAAQDMLQAHPEVNIVYGTNADHALAALAAFENAGRGKAVNGKPLTEIFVGTDATEAELLKLFNPTSSFKITQGLQPKANAEAEVDTMMKMVNKQLAWDKWVEIPTLDILFSYWGNKVEDGTAFLKDQYFMDVDLAKELAKK
jgi:ribose transport system substrate-binding protein